MAKRNRKTRPQQSAGASSSKPISTRPVEPPARRPFLLGTSLLLLTGWLVFLAVMALLQN